MKKPEIDYLISKEELRIREVDYERVKSILKSSETNARVVLRITPTEESATVIFRELYESVRQLGEAAWWLQGFEPLNHAICLRILEEMDIKDKVKLNHLSRFKRIRNDINYRGYQATLPQALEMLDFWNMCGKEILKILKSKK